MIWAATEMLPGRSSAGVLLRADHAGIFLALGVALLAWPNVTGPVISRMVAVALAVVSLRGFSRAIRTDDLGRRRLWWAIHALLILAVALRYGWCPT